MGADAFVVDGIWYHHPRGNDAMVPRPMFALLSDESSSLSVTRFDIDVCELCWVQLGMIYGRPCNVHDEYDRGPTEAPMSHLARVKSGLRLSLALVSRVTGWSALLRHVRGS